MNLSTLQSRAVSALITANRPGVLAVLNKYSIPVSGESDDALYDGVMRGMVSSEEFTAEIIQLMKGATDRKINALGGGGDPTSDIIGAALQGIGQVTSTWQSVAQKKVDAQIEAQKLQNEKKLSQGAIIGIVFGSIALLGLIAFGIVMATRKKVVAP